MRWMPRLRTLLARHPWIYWTFVAGVAFAVAVSVSSALAEVRRARDGWGETQKVFVATAPISPGETVGGLVEARDYPAAMVPVAAAMEVAPSATATQRIGTGEIVVQADVSAVGGSLGLLPTGWLAITFDGPVNEVYSAGVPAAVMAGGATVAAQAVVIRVLDDAVVVGVPSDVAARVAEAVAQGLAVLALSGS